MNFTIGKKIFAGYAVALLSIVILTSMAFFSVRQLKQNFHNAKTARDFIDSLDAFHDFVLNGQDAQRAFLITGNPTNLSQFQLIPPALDSKVKGLRNAQGATGRSMEITHIETQARTLLNQLESETKDRQSTTLADNVSRSTENMQRLISAIEHLKSLELTESSDLDQATNTTATQLERIIQWGTPLIVAIICLIGYFIVRNITTALARIESAATRMADGDFTVILTDCSRRDEIGTLSRSFASMIQALSSLIAQVQRSGLQVNSSTVEISASTKEQQTTAGEVATTSAEISATAKEMSATSTELLKTADNVRSVADEANELASAGKDGLIRMESIMRGILDASVSITAKLGVMNEKAGNINAVVSTIGKV
ncbi:MAG: hypothetical protein RLZZ282_590, partial [Verrucomicrobiota bacterium]